MMDEKNIKQFFESTWFIDKLNADILPALPSGN